MNSTETETELKKFGLLMAFVFAIFAIISFLAGGGIYLYLLLLSTVFLIPAIFLPASLELVWKGWMGFGERISRVVTFVILVLSFFLVITPIGFLYRMFSKNPLGLKFEHDRDSYWDEVSKDAPGTRYYTPY